MSPAPGARGPHSAAAEVGGGSRAPGPHGRAQGAKTRLNGKTSPQRPQRLARRWTRTGKSCPRLGARPRPAADFHFDFGRLLASSGCEEPRPSRPDEDKLEALSPFQLAAKRWISFFRCGPLQLGLPCSCSGTSRVQLGRDSVPPRLE